MDYHRCSFFLETFKSRECHVLKKAKEDVFYIYIYTYIKWRKDEIFPFLATWMDLEVITLSDVSGERQIPYDFTHMWNRININVMNKWDKNKHTDTENRVVVTKGEARWRIDEMDKGVEPCGDGWKLNLWWWACCSVYRSWNIMLYTWNSHKPMFQFLNKTASCLHFLSF